MGDRTISMQLSSIKDSYMAISTVSNMHSPKRAAKASINMQGIAFAGLWSIAVVNSLYNQIVCKGE